ncbi:hypothetical protein ACFL2U_01525 [Patescibacteria group bacterium]
MQGNLAKKTKFGYISLPFTVFQRVTRSTKKTKIKEIGNGYVA